jgi:hypothetical protein
MADCSAPYLRRSYDSLGQMRRNTRIRNGIHSSNPKEIKKSLEVLSAPLPIADPNGSGAGIKPQLALLILSASTQYLSPLTLPLSMLSAADLNMLAAFRSASSFPPTTSCALNAWTEGIGGGFVTIVAVSVDEGNEGIGDGCVGEVDARSKEISSLA